jgi:UTP--glucose-1-phosphate uridylyltransferase
MKKINKAVVLIAGLGTRFLPFSKTLPKELFPLADLPILQHILTEIRDSGIKEVIFVNRREKKDILNYFKEDKKLKNFLKKKNKFSLLKKVEEVEKFSKQMTFRQVFQEKPLGAAEAILKARKFIKPNEGCAISFSDDIIHSKTPCLKQLIEVSEKYQAPSVALSAIPKESFQHYGMAKTEKIFNRLFKIKKLVEKPSAEKSPSNLAVVGKYVITAEVFEILEKISFNLETEISLTEILGKMAEKGENVYGKEIEGKWLECGNKLAYLKSNFYFCLNHPQFGKELKKYIKKELL